MVVFTLLLLWWLWVPITVGIWWLICANFWPGIGWQNGLETLWYNWFAHGNVTWVYLLIGSIAGAIGAFAYASGNDDEAGVGVGLGLAQVVVMLLSIGCLIGFNINLDKHEGQYYANSATFYVQDPGHLPEAIQRLGSDGASPGDGCAVLYRGTKNDSHGCVKKGDLPADAWVPRIGSHDTAVKALTNSSAVMPGVSLDADTVTYLNGAKAGVWSGVVDGQGLQNPLGGVSEWDGQGIARTCTFTGDYAIDRAFHGSKSNSLNNLIAERWPLLSYKMTDVWGFCQDHGDKAKKDSSGNHVLEPVVVVPVTRPMPWSHRTVDAPAGILVVRGDHGKTVVELKTDSVAGDEYPGAVYPLSLTERQRVESSWAAGRQNHQVDGGNHFGFEPTNDTDVQNGSVAEFLLKDQRTGRLEFVTPLTLRGSSSQLFLAFAISYADEVHAGKLNPVSIYVFNDNDNRRVPIQKLVAAANQWLNENHPMLKANGTTLKEFEPINGDTWRGYLENNTQVWYMLDVVWDGSLQTLAKTVMIPMGGKPPVADTPPGLAPTTPDGAVIPGMAYCGQPLDKLNVTQLQTCANAIIGELSQRASK